MSTLKKKIRDLIKIFVIFFHIDFLISPILFIPQTKLFGA